MTAEAPVTVQAVCPSCDGRCCVVCGNTGRVVVRIVDDREPMCARCRIHCEATADTLRPGQLEEDTTP